VDLLSEGCTSLNPMGSCVPLGMPTWSDKLLQEVMRSVLEAYYEPQFSIHSHGFRPGGWAVTLRCSTSPTIGRA